MTSPRMALLAAAAALAAALSGCGTSVRGHNLCPQILVPEEPKVPDYAVVPITHDGKRGVFLALDDAETVVRSIKDWQYAFRQLKRTVETYNRWAEREVREAPE